MSNKYHFTVVHKDPAYIDAVEAAIDNLNDRMFSNAYARITFRTKDKDQYILGVNTNREKDKELAYLVVRSVDTGWFFAKNQKVNA